MKLEPTRSEGGPEGGARQIWPSGAAARGRRGSSWFPERLF